ncbi:hypothetical protein Ancab_008345 [Ancistrocladus abbreviatus]
MESAGLTNPLPLLINTTKWWSKETTAIVTGANRGIGFEVVKRLAQSGLTVILTARDTERGLKAVQLLGNQGIYVHFCRLDVSDPASISAFASWFGHKFGVLDILVNNAGVSFKDVHENSVKEAETVMKTNFHGPKLLIEALFPFFRCSSSKTRILNISSRLGLVNKVRNQKIRAILEDEENLTEESVEGIVNLFMDHIKNGKWESEGWPEAWTDYAVSKLALNAYSKVLAKRFKDCNICVNCYCPGFTQTSMTGGRGSRTADVAAGVAASLALLEPQLLQTGKFTMGHNLYLHSRF